MAILPTDNLIIDRAGTHYKAPVSALPSGSDPWTYVRLTSGFTNNTTTGTASPLAFTPAANTRYEVVGSLRLRTAVTTTGAQPGIAWPTGCNDGTSEVWASITATSSIRAYGQPWGETYAASTGHPNTNWSWAGGLSAEFETGPTPTGMFRVMLRSEVASSLVTIAAGSFIRFRAIP